MTTGGPLITAALTAYDAEDTIAGALASALAQDWPSLEVLILDDASRDGTRKVIEAVITERGDQGPPIRLIALDKNGGVAQARNRLLAEAKGEVIAFFDDDDISAPDRLRRQYARLIAAERETGAGLVFCHAARCQILPDGGERLEGTMGEEGGPIPGGDAVVRRILLGTLSPGVRGSCATCSQMARTASYRALGGFDPTLRRAEDTDLCLRAALGGAVFAGLSAPLVTQRLTLGGDKTPREDHRAYQALLNKHRATLAKTGWLTFYARWQDIRLAHLEGRTGRVVLGLVGLGLSHPLKLARKIVWSLPAAGTRAAYHRQHRKDTS